MAPKLIFGSSLIFIKILRALLFFGLIHGDAIVFANIML